MGWVNAIYEKLKLKKSKYSELTKMMVTLLCGFSLLFYTGIQVPGGTADIKLLLLQAQETADWMPEDEYQRAIGDDLYLLINGGAEIYLEYGFKQAVYQTYADQQGNRINLEIYQMTDSAAAYGMYTFKTKTHGKDADLRCEGWMSDYYLSFWKGCYVITLIGMDVNEKIQSGLMQIARVLESKIVQTSQRPRIVFYLPTENLSLNGLSYIRGNLALVNQYPFATQNILNCTEGAAGAYPGYSLFLFEYPDAVEAQNWYLVAQNFIRESEQYAGYKHKNNTFKVMDKKEKTLLFMIYDRWILVFIGSSDSNAEQLLETLRLNLTH